MPHADRVEDLTWKVGTFFAAEECDRQLLIGSTEHEGMVPESIRRIATKPNNFKFDSSILMEKGEDAYRHLLNVAVGMLDKQLGEKETITAMRDRWAKFSTHADNGRSNMAKFGPLMESLFADCTAVRAKVFEDRVGGNYLRPVGSEPAVAARNMLDIKPIDQVLIIGNGESITLNTLKVIDTAFRKQVKLEAKESGIVLTHPDPKMLDQIRVTVATMQHEHKLKGSVTCIPYSKAMSDVFGKADFVFNCQPHDNGANDKALMEAASKRSNNTGLLIHLRGVPLNRDKTSEVWHEAGLERVFFNEDIQRQAQLDRVHNQRMRELAETAITNCIASRGRGFKPLKDKLLMPEDE
ncbi:MAG: hypothetical protein K2Q01_03145, partial [Rickettsiales bacterium]|nr:hypothetical protein [Rickettsiales bacterium]